MIVSFCIPTLNRAHYLIQTIRSICSDVDFSTQFEICIYNNCSDSDYTEVEKEISVLSESFNITYTKGDIRLEIDHSMFEAVRHAVGEYLFLIGDDDYLQTNALKDIYDLINNEEVDLAVFNALRVSDQNEVGVELIGFKNKRYFDFEEALLELKEYCTYGNLLVKREFMKPEDFKYLFGTSHAYGCFWLSFFRRYELGDIPRIVVPSSSVVCLRYIEKNYDLMQVTFKDASFEYQLFSNVIGEKSKTILSKFDSRLQHRFTSLKFLLNLGLAKNDLGRIKSINEKYYEKNKLKILFADLLSKTALKFKRPIKFLLKMGARSK